MRKVALIRRNGLGDLLCAFPLISYFRKHFPKDHLTLFVDERNAPLLPYLSPLDRVVIFPSQGMKYWNVGRIGLQLRKEQFDLAISAKTSPMKLMNLFLFALGAKKRIAYVDDAWHSRLVNAPISFDKRGSKTLHQALKGLHLIAPDLKTIPEEFYPIAKVSDEAKKRHPLERSQMPVLLISATTTRLASRLAPKRYAGLVNELYKQFSFSVALVGQKEDRERALAIAKELKPCHQIHFPRNFEAFMVLLDSCDLYFVGDGGIAHIGAALGKPGVILFGETNPVEWHPLSRQMQWFYDPAHVDNISDEKIYQSLNQMVEQCLSKN